MRVLLVHNFYRDPGGEDYAFHADATVLSRAGHTVEKFARSSARATETAAGVLRTALQTPWALDAAADLDPSELNF